LDLPPERQEHPTPWRTSRLLRRSGNQPLATREEPPATPPTASIDHWTIPSTICSREILVLRDDITSAVALRLGQPPRATTSSQCVEGSPGDAIKNLFWDPVNSGQIAGNYRKMIAAIKAGGEKAGKVPRIILTTYHQPLPTKNQSIECADLGDLSRDAIEYLRTLEQKLHDTLVPP
jgi:hypothetical protein